MLTHGCMQVPVVPISLIGTGSIMPSQQELKMFPGHVRVVVHPPIPPKAANVMMQEARHAIASALTPTQTQ